MLSQLFVNRVAIDIALRGKGQSLMCGTAENVASMAWRNIGTLTHLPSPVIVTFLKSPLLFPDASGGGE